MSNNIVVGDCVKNNFRVILRLLYYGPWFKYGDENEIPYFTEKKTISRAKYCVLKENNLDLREKCELKKVVAALDDRDRYTFSDYQTV